MRRSPGYRWMFSSVLRTSTGCRLVPGGRTITVRATAGHGPVAPATECSGNQRASALLTCATGFPTAPRLERIRGHDDFERLDSDADLFRDAAPWTEDSFRTWCSQLTDAEAASFPKHPSDANSGMNWLEGNMTWTRYNHVLPPGSKSCANGLTWNGVAMTSNSRHAKVVGVLLGDGSVRPIKYSIAATVWKALGTIAGGETVSADAF